jgi:hypothetical protein
VLLADLVSVADLGMYLFSGRQFVAHIFWRTIAHNFNAIANPSVMFAMIAKCY